MGYSEITSTPKKRYEWVDTAKGFCILLVVVHHLMASYNLYEGIRPNIYYSLQSFRIPLYYILSGMFFKTYGGVWNFIIKKTNKILIPCLFFYLIFSVFFPILLSMLNYDVFDIEGTPLYEILTAIYYKEGNYPNGPVWFLICLFQVNIIFCLINKLTNSMSFIVIASCCIGFIGLLLSYARVNLYLNTDSALSAMPFFCLGYVIKHRSKLLSDSPYSLFFNICVPLFSFLFVFFLSRNVEFNFNLFANKLTVYPCGMLGAFSVLLLCKNVGRLPVISYYGRYSIMILCTHYFILDLLHYILKGTFFDTWLFVFLVLMLSYFLIIPFCKHYIPYFTAQKDLLRCVN